MFSSAGQAHSAVTYPIQTISRFSVNGVAFDVGTRSRRRASQPRPGGFASRCLSRARERNPARYARSSCHLLTRSASSARTRPGREAQGLSAAPGRAFFGFFFFCLTLWKKKKKTPPAAARLAASKRFRHRRRRFNSDRGHKAAPTQTRPSPLPLSRRGRGIILPTKLSPRVPTPPACQITRAHPRRSTWYPVPAPAR
jgi:hypothetical protein